MFGVNLNFRLILIESDPGCDFCSEILISRRFFGDWSRIRNIRNNTNTDADDNTDTSNDADTDADGADTDIDINAPFHLPREFWNEKRRRRGFLFLNPDKKDLFKFVRLFQYSEMIFSFTYLLQHRGGS